MKTRPRLLLLQCLCRPGLAQTTTDPVGGVRLASGTWF